MAQNSTSAVDRLNERALQAENSLNAVANGREVDMQQPQWKLPNGKTEPLSRQDRELVIRWQFLVGGAAAIRSFGSRVADITNERFAEAYLRADDEIGPVCILAGEQKTNVLFGDGDQHVMTPKEQAAVNRFLDGHDAYRAELLRYGSGWGEKA